MQFGRAAMSGRQAPASIILKLVSIDCFGVARGGSDRGSSVSNTTARGAKDVTWISLVPLAEA